MAERIPQPLERRVASLETHLKLLREALGRLEAEPDLYKLMAGQLRVLVVDAGANRPLLLDLMDEAEVEYSISPDPTLPFPLPLVDEEPPPVPAGFHEWPPEQIWEYHRQQGRSYPLREFVRRGLAVFILGESYSYEKLIRMLAENSGTSHEDQKVDRNLLEMESVAIGGYLSHSAVLRPMASNVLEAGRAVIQAALTAGYSPRYFVVDSGHVRYPS